MTGTKSVNAAIVGLGRWGQNLVNAAMSDPTNTLKFTRAVTRTPAKAQSFCDSHALPLSADFGDLLQNPDIQAIVLATPHSQHADQIKLAAKAGKHVFVEKPLALTLSEGLDVSAACDAANVVLAVGFNRRFLPAYRALEKLLISGDLGQPLHAEGNFSGPFGYDYSGDMWRGTISENPAGGMAAMGIHVLDAMIHLLGPISHVTARSSRRVLKAPIDDTTTILLDFSSGVTGSLTTIMATATNWRLQIFGSTGWVAMRDQRKLEWSTLNNEVQSRRFETADTLAMELDAFGKTILGIGEYPVTLSEALAGVAAMHAIARSASEPKLGSCVLV